MKDDSKNVQLPIPETPDPEVDPSPVPKQCRCHGDLEKNSVIVTAEGKCGMCGRLLFGQSVVTSPVKKEEDNIPKTEDVERVKKFKEGMYFVERLPNGAFGRLIYIEAMNDKEITFREPGMEKVDRPNWMVKFPAYKDQPHILRDKQPSSCSHESFRNLLVNQHFERVINDELVRTMAAH
jgi:hypothetical protein